MVSCPSGQHTYLNDYETHYWPKYDPVNTVSEVIVDVRP